MGKTFLRGYLHLCWDIDTWGIYSICMTMVMGQSRITRMDSLTTKEIPLQFLRHFPSDSGPVSNLAYNDNSNAFDLDCLFLMLSFLLIHSYIICNILASQRSLVRAGRMHQIEQYVTYLESKARTDPKRFYTDKFELFTEKQHTSDDFI
jgi:hypothetical protein